MSLALLSATTPLLEKPRVLKSVLARPPRRPLFTYRLHACHDAPM
ncbi:MAG: hypothetical protein ACK5L0_02340 [Candidatus Fimivivens sp.]